MLSAVYVTKVKTPQTVILQSVTNTPPVLNNINSSLLFSSFSFFVDPSRTHVFRLEPAEKDNTTWVRLSGEVRGPRTNLPHERIIFDGVQSTFRQLKLKQSLGSSTSLSHPSPERMKLQCSKYRIISSMKE